MPWSIASLISDMGQKRPPSVSVPGVIMPFMSTHSGVPSARLDIFPPRTFLEIKMTIVVEYVQMHHWMKQFRAAMAFATGGFADDTTVLIDYRNYLFGIISRTLSNFHHKGNIGNHSMM